MSFRKNANFEGVNFADLTQISLITPEAQEVGREQTSQQTVSINSVSAYFKAIGRIPLLSREEELSEARKVQHYIQVLKIQAEGTTTIENEHILQDGLRAKHRMIQANLRLVIMIAQPYQKRGLDLMDLIQEGNLGLNRAVEKFDPTKGYRFSTYASWWIRQGITRAITSQSRAIRLPENITERLNVLKQAQRQILQAKGRTATVEELAAALQSSPDSIDKLLSHTRQPVSLNLKIGQAEETELGELIESEVKLPEELVMSEMLPETLNDLLKRLEYRERRVIELRFGLRRMEAQPLTETAKVLNISVRRVRQIEANALKKLRQFGVEQQVQGFLEALA